MLQPRRRALAWLLVLLNVPLAGASWGSGGAYEPDTLYDTQWEEPDHDPDPNHSLVFFNVHPVTLGLVAPNAGALGTTVLTPYTTFRAHMGVWKDCNGDGHVGSALLGAEVYPAQALLRADICPSDASPHRIDGWIHEMLHIGPACTLEQRSAGRTDCPAPGPGVLPDEEAMVWGDVGLPWEAPPLPCPTVLVPIDGADSSVARTIRAGDCLMTLERVWNASSWECTPTAGARACRSAETPDAGDAHAILYECGRGLDLRDPVSGRPVPPVEEGEPCPVRGEGDEPLGPALLAEYVADRLEYHDTTRARDRSDWSFVFYPGHTSPPTSPEEAAARMFGGSVPPGGIPAFARALDLSPGWYATTPDPAWAAVAIDEETLQPEQHTAPRGVLGNGC